MFDNNASSYGSINSAIYVYIALELVEITNCAGYNDQHTVFPVSAPPTPPFNGVTVANYYGPTVFYTKEALVTIDTKTTHLSDGIFTLSASSETASLAGLGG